MAMSIYVRQDEQLYALNLPHHGPRLALLMPFFRKHPRVWQSLLERYAHAQPNLDLPAKALHNDPFVYIDTSANHSLMCQSLMHPQQFLLNVENSNHLVYIANALQKGHFESLLLDQLSTSTKNWHSHYYPFVATALHQPFVVGNGAKRFTLTDCADQPDQCAARLKALKKQLDHSGTHTAIARCEADPHLTHVLASASVSAAQIDTFCQKAKALLPSNEDLVALTNWSCPSKLTRSFAWQHSLYEQLCSYVQQAQLGQLLLEPTNVEPTTSRIVSAPQKRL